jgi:hypothetical protein
VMLGIALVYARQQRAAGPPVGGEPA